MDESIKTVLSVSWKWQVNFPSLRLCRKAGKKEGRVSSAGRKRKRVIALKGGFTKGSHLQPRKRGCGQGCGRRRQEEDSYRRKEGVQPQGLNTAERGGLSGESSVPGDGWLSWSLSRLQVTVRAQVCSGRCLPSFLRGRGKGLNKTNNQSHHRSLPSRFYTPRGMIEQKSIEKTPTPLMETTKSVDHLCVEQTFIQHLLIVRHTTRASQEIEQGRCLLPFWYFCILRD